MEHSNGCAMKRISHHFVSFCLAVLLTAFGAGAQNGLQYWIDDFSSARFIAMPSAAGQLKVTINVEDLSLGVHKIYMRSVSADGTYSPVTQAAFVKVVGGDGMGFEYWFDDDLESLTTRPYMLSEAQTYEVDLSDPAFAPGVHKVSMRALNPDFGYSPVYSASFVKIAYAGATGLEYWIDDNPAATATLPLNAGSDAPQAFDIALSDPAIFPPGVHKVSMRVVDPSLGYSPVYTAMVTNLPATPDTHIVYWLDNDYAGRRKLQAIETGDAARFFSFLDLSTATEGMHHIKFRIMGSVEKGTVYSYPILVTRRYNSLNSNVFVSRENYWHDLASRYRDFKGQTLHTATYELDPADFDAGQHEFHVQYMNSEQVWSEENVTYFYKAPGTSMLVAGMLPPDASGIGDLPADVTDESFFCTVNGENIVVDCLSPRLGSMAAITVYDIIGRVVARTQVPSTTDGVHAELNIPGYAGKVLIVRVFSGEACFTRKIVMQVR